MVKRVKEDHDGLDADLERFTLSKFKNINGEGVVAQIAFGAVQYYNEEMKEI